MEAVNDRAGSLRAVEELYRHADLALWGSVPRAEVVERDGFWAVVRHGNPYPLASCRLTAGTTEGLRGVLAVGEEVAREYRTHLVYRVVPELLPPGASLDLERAGCRPKRPWVVMALRELSQAGGLPENPRVRVRLAGRDDVDFVAAAIARGLGFERQRAAALHEALPALVERPTCLVFVAEVDGAQVATNVTVRLGDACVLAYAATSPGWQGQGVGVTLFLEILGLLSVSGVKVCFALVDPEGTARRLDDRLGFRPEYGVTSYLRLRGPLRWIARAKVWAGSAGA